MPSSLRRGPTLVAAKSNLPARRLGPIAAASLLAVVTLTSARTALGQGAAVGVSYDPADVRFMQGMISHHAQALAMVKLIPDHTTNPQLHSAGQRIQISQKDEIGLMQRWLQGHGQPVPNVDSNFVAHMPGSQTSQGQMPGMDMSGMAMMPGMLTQGQMAELAKAKGPEFDRLFLKGMIQHHEGALTMVADLFHTNGAGQESEIYRFASDVDADQRAEIKRMHAMLDAIPKGTAKP